MRSLLLLLKDLVDKDVYKHISSQKLKQYSEIINDIIKYSTSDEILDMFQKFGVLEAIKLSSMLPNIVKDVDSSKSMKASEPKTWFLDKPEAILSIPVLNVPASDMPYDKPLSSISSDALKSGLKKEFQLCFSIGPGTKSWGVAGFYLPEEKEISFNVPYLMIFASEGTKPSSKYTSAKRFFNYMYNPQTLEVFLHEFRHACDISIMEKSKDAFIEKFTKLAKAYFTPSKTKLKGTKLAGIQFLRSYKDDTLLSTQENLSFFMDHLRTQGSGILKSLYTEYIFRTRIDNIPGEEFEAREACSDAFEFVIDSVIPRTRDQLAALLGQTSLDTLEAALDSAYKKRLKGMKASEISTKELFEDHLVEFGGRLLLIGLLEATKRYNISAMCETKDDILKDVKNKALIESFAPSEAVTYRLFHILDSLSLNYLGLSVDALSSFMHPSLSTLNKDNPDVVFVSTLSNDYWAYELSTILRAEYSTKMLEDIFQCVAGSIPDEDFDKLAEYFSENIGQQRVLGLRYWLQRLLGLFAYDISLKSPCGLLYQLLGRYYSKKLIKEEIIPGTDFEVNKKFYDYSYELFRNNKLRFKGLLNNDPRNLYLLNHTLIKSLNTLILGLPNTLKTLRALHSSQRVRGLYYDVTPDIRGMIRALEKDLKAFKQAIDSFVILACQTSVELNAIHKSSETAAVINGLKAGISKLRKQAKLGKASRGGLESVLKSCGFENYFKALLAAFGSQVMIVYPQVASAKYKEPKTMEEAISHYVGFTAEDFAFLVGIYSDVLEYFEGLDLMFGFEFVSIASAGLLFGDVDKGVSSLLEHLNEISGLLLMDTRELGVDGLRLMMLGMSIVEMLVSLEYALLVEYP